MGTSDGHEAWAVVGSWRGSPKLLAHLARRLEACAGGSGVVIELHVGDDEECFDSADEFLDKVSAQALQSFDRLRITAGGESSVEAEVRLQRRQYPKTHPVPKEALPRAGAVLSVTGHNAADIRDELVPALKRGSLRRPRSRAFRGPSHPFLAPEEQLKDRGLLTDRLEAAGAIFLTILVAVAASFVRLPQEVRCGDGLQPDCREEFLFNLTPPSSLGLAFAAAIGVLLGVLLAVVRSRRPDLNPMLSIWSPVEVADQTVVRSLLKGAAAIVPVGAIVGWASQLLASAF